MKLKTLNDLDFKDKTIILRADLNAEISNGKPTLSDRFVESAKTIKELQGKKAKVVVIAHQSRPGKEDFTSLKKHAKLLNKFVKIKFIPDIIGKKAVKAITKLKPGKAILLENIRTLDEEFNPGKDNALLKVLSNLSDIYVNDAFSVCHRKHTSIISFPKVLQSCIGRTLQREIESLSKVKNLKNALFILGGSKSENTLFLDRKNVFCVGVFSHLCLMKSGKNLGAQNDFLKEQFKKMKNLKFNVDRKNLPKDLAVRVDGKRKDINISDFPSKYEVYDIGPKTQKEIVQKIKKAKVIFMKGTAGYCEEEQFCQGTEKILRAIAKSKSFSILSGGHTSTALEKFKINKKKFNYISLSGGATVQFLIGNKLPGLEALNKKRGKK